MRRVFPLVIVLLAIVLAGSCQSSSGGSQATTPSMGQASQGAAVQGGSSSPNRVTSTPPNPPPQKPVSVPGAIPTQGGVPLQAHLFDAGSYDPDGDGIVAWEWNFADEEEGQGGWHDYTATQGDAWHTYTVAGAYTAHLRVTDSTGRKGVGHIQVTLNDGFNANPIAVAHANPLSGNAPLEVSFSTQGSYDPDGNISKYEWDFGTGIFLDYTSSQGTVSTTYGSGGLYTAILRITDDDGAIATNSVTIEVNSPPTAVASASPTSGAAPLTVHLSAQGSYDPNGFIASCEWDFGEGGGFQDFTATQGEVDHIYTQAGTYTATLRVTDDWGKAVMAGAQVQVLSPSAQGDWWMFGHDPQHTRRSPFTGPATNALKWACHLESSVFSSPAIGADGTIYVGNYTLDISSKLFAVNPNGTIKWAYTTAGNIMSSPAIGADGTVYVGCDDKNLYAINPDGTLKWAYTTGSAVWSSPTIGADGTVYVGSYDCRLYAFNPDGSLKWAYTTGDAVTSSPAIGADGTIYVGSYDNNLYAINPDGTLKWTYYTGLWGIISSPAIGADGTIYVGSNYEHKLYAINPNGTLKWTYATGNIIYSSPAIGADGTVYVGSADGKLYAINPDGTLKWSYATNGGIDYSSPAIGADGTVYIGSWDNKLHAVNPDGTLKWAYAMPSNRVQSSPAIGADGTVYVGSIDRILYAIGPGEGS